MNGSGGTRPGAVEARSRAVEARSPGLAPVADGPAPGDAVVGSAPVAPARLRALRVLGFKSFAERIVLEFGPGISAIVGPNGSGKSNLADALRWALGEQGRSLRTRKSEDVIFAGSARRHALGMADVTLVIDNEDGLLPLDFAEVDLGRRVFRSGENEYLVNRQRVRFRDLVDLLDAANLADNAFLFIGQGMVDQALSLRPEERRPLFEEVAGVRRHERRRRQAEEQLAEAEGNLSRVRDILDELRPQLRRLAMQAEQQEARQGAAHALAQALVAHARSRWVTTVRSSNAIEATLATARAEATRALGTLRDAERALETATARLAERATAERSARNELDAQRAIQTDLRLAHGRAASAVEATDAELRRLDAERTAVERRADEARRALAVPVTAADAGDLADRIATLDGELREAQAEVAALRSAEAASRERRDALRRAIAAREAELERSRRRVAEIGRRAAADAERAARAAELGRATTEGRERAEAARAAASATVTETERRLEQARNEAEAADRERARTASEHEAARRDLERLRGRLAALEESLERETGTALLAAARRHGGERVAEGLEVDPALRRAVEAALGAALHAVAVPGSVVARLSDVRGTLLLREAGARRAERSGRTGGVVGAATERGGGALEEAVVADPAGLVRELLRTSAWVPTLEDALALQAGLPPGWRVATRAGEVVTAEGLVRIGTGRSMLELQAERDDVREALQAAATTETTAAERARAARAGAEDAREVHDRTRREADAARAALRRAEEEERGAARAAETAAREQAWAATQAERSRHDLEGATADLARREQEPDDAAHSGRDEARIDVTDEGGEPGAAAIEAWTRRVTEIRAERDRLRETWEAAQRRRAALDEERRRIEVRLAMDEARLGELDRERAGALERRAALGTDASRLAHEVERAAADVAQLAAVLEGLAAADQVDRTELQALETRAVGARERVRRAEEQVRAAEVQGVEGRLQLETIREGLLVELAALGDVGLAVLEAEGATVADIPERPPLVPVMPGAVVTVAAAVAGGAAATPLDADGTVPSSGAVPEEATAARLEGALARAIHGWSAGDDRDGGAGPGEPIAPARLGALRRRYQELGASNPFAAEEYARIRGRVEELEGQRRDLDAAIAETRRLIGELSQLVSERFQATFRALEGAFARRFEQLFGGGEARLVLTEPSDLSATGVEILARPPGKKRQPLAMLSGGERALTAVALLFAMLEVRPVPFCVLDEVDAALDEANIARFAAALRGLAASTQFIVITHNRGTIEAADALYGVTIGDDAVSRVISLRLADLPPKEDRSGRPAAARHPSAPTAVGA